MINKNQQGYIVFISVLIVGTVATIIGVSVLLLGLGSSRASFALEQSKQANALANLCIEEALQQIHDSVPYSGTDTLTFDEGSCTYAVIDNGGHDRDITAVGEVGSVVRRMQASIDTITPNINITSWQEVADF